MPFPYEYSQWRITMIRSPPADMYRRMWQPLQPFHSQEWSISNFPCSLTRNITSHSMKNLAFHSLLRWKMIMLPILPFSHVFDLGSGRVNATDQRFYVHLCPSWLVIRLACASTQPAPDWLAKLYRIWPIAELSASLSASVADTRPIIFASFA